VLRDDPPAGQEAQIDYGYLGHWVDPVGERRRRVSGFVMVLACSRHLFLRLGICVSCSRSGEAWLNSVCSLPRLRRR
jgi:hypothetical protein